MTSFIRTPRNTRKPLLKKKKSKQPKLYSKHPQQHRLPAPNPRELSELYLAKSKATDAGLSLSWRQLRRGIEVKFFKPTTDDNGKQRWWCVAQWWSWSSTLIIGPIESHADSACDALEMVVAAV
jgi:hypothetical protein